MAAELGKFISEQLVKLPKNHIDRGFLELKLAEVKEREGLKREQSLPTSIGENISPEELLLKRAEERLKEMIDLDIIDNGEYAEKTIRGNVSHRRAFPEDDDSIYSLMPVNWKFSSALRNALWRSGVCTEGDLIIKSEAELAGMRAIGSKGLKFAIAMRNVAIAKACLRSSNNPQI